MPKNKDWTKTMVLLAWKLGKELKVFTSTSIRDVVQKEHPEMPKGDAATTFSQLAQTKLVRVAGELHQSPGNNVFEVEDKQWLLQPESVALKYGLTALNRVSNVRWDRK